MQLKQHNNNEYDNNGVYRLKCMYYPLQYICKRGRSFKTRFIEYMRAMKYKKNMSTYALPKINTGHMRGHTGCNDNNTSSQEI
jgi:hypothetical protein